MRYELFAQCSEIKYLYACGERWSVNLGHILSSVHDQCDTSNRDSRGQVSMQWVDLSAQQRARRRYAVIGAVIFASLAGLLVGWSEAQSKDLTPAEVVALRFPIAWSNLAARSAPAVTAVAKNQIVFDPSPSYDLASADSKPVIPSGVLAYGDPVESITPPQASPAPEARPAERRASLVP